MPAVPAPFWGMDEKIRAQVSIMLRDCETVFDRAKNVEHLTPVFNQNRNIERVHHLLKQFVGDELWILTTGNAAMS